MDDNAGISDSYRNSAPKKQTRPLRAELSQELGHRIKIVVDLHKSVSAAARIAGISRDQLYNYYIGTSKPAFIPLAKLAQASNIHLDWLWSGEGPMRRDEASPPVPGATAWSGDPSRWPHDIPLPAHLVRVPLLSTVAALGVPVEAQDEHVEDWAVVPRADVPHPAKSAALRVQGDSMFPILQEGWLVGVDAAPEALAPLEVLDGKLVVVRLDDGGGGISVKWCRVGRHNFTIEAENYASGFAISAFPRSESPRIIAKITWVFGRW